MVWCSAGAMTIGQMIKHTDVVMNAVKRGDLQNVERLIDRHVGRKLIEKARLEPYLCVGDSHTYERVAIEQWFATGARTSPTTNERLDNLTLVPNHAMRRLIAALLERRRET